MVAMCHPVWYELTSISFFIPLNCTPSTQAGHVNTYASIRMRMSSKAPRATPPPPRRLTMKQIGHLAGVSQSTVSRVLSGAASIVPVGGAQPKPRRQTLLPSLVVRDSTAPPPKELA